MYLCRHAMRDYLGCPASHTLLQQCDQEAWFAPDKAAVGPAARAFHAAAAIGRKM